jgi:hypothetical protein
MFQHRKEERRKASQANPTKAVVVVKSRPVFWMAAVVVEEARQGGRATNQRPQAQGGVFMHAVPTHHSATGSHPFITVPRRLWRVGSAGTRKNKPGLRAIYRSGRFFRAIDWELSSNIRCPIFTHCRQSKS